jgi:hypothetical protein
MTAGLLRGYFTTILWGSFFSFKEDNSEKAEFVGIAKKNVHFTPRG